MGIFSTFKIWNLDVSLLRRFFPLNCTRLTVTEDSGPVITYCSNPFMSLFIYLECIRSSHFGFVQNPRILCLNVLDFSYSSPQSKITLIICFSFSQSAKLSQRPLHWFHCKLMLALISPRSYFSVKKKSIFYELPAAFH